MKVFIRADECLRDVGAYALVWLGWATQWHGPRRFNRIACEAQGVSQSWSLGTPLALLVVIWVLSQDRGKSLRGTGQLPGNRGRSPQSPKEG